MAGGPLVEKDGELVGDERGVAQGILRRDLHQYTPGASTLVSVTLQAVMPLVCKAGPTASQ